ncbi:hypothetical protein BC351_19625 [Paenibacillus ferrarius]|uniref:Uncharacterized protein n=1 Tax=Paenibacillus ferrarius TaxID=1469647 RepID=A0A1V4HQ14_9BACL|nr:hypothetical protein [Paenibacillus ferrarius]OPH59693.1 hypothetical protein BC351_19625 [Paenibacillus ferrarius]
MKTQIKRYTSRVSLLAFAATMAFGAVSAYAADSNTETKELTTLTAANTTTSTNAFQVQASAASLLFQPAHQRNYLKLLASTYAPETLTQWKQALEDRKQAENELPKIATFRSVTMKNVDGSAVKDDTTAATTSESFVAGEAIPALPAIELSKDAELSSGNKIFVKRLNSDELSGKEAVQAIPFEGVTSGVIMKGEPTESFKRQQKLAEAVEADDAATIKSLLPELLKDYKSETESIRTMAVKIKEAAEKAKAESTEQSKK